MSIQLLNINIESKGHKEELSTFKSWRKEKCKGYKTECKDGKTFAKFVFCHNKFA